MATIPFNQYIEAGCLHVFAGQRGMQTEPSSLTSCQPQQWYFLQRAPDKRPLHPPLSAEIQDALLESVLLPFTRLFEHRWIELSFSAQTGTGSSEVTGRIRVYLRPHDVNRTFYSLPYDVTRPTATLLGRLDYSRECWSGQEYDLLPKPEQSPDSALKVFNEMPSPDPQPENVTDPNVRWTMNCLLESQVPGLTTTLYHHQGRSAALMLQRELCPSRDLDSRLQTAIDQRGSTWYYDSIAGEVLRDPIFYDRVRGGLLAEHMGVGKTLICLALILSTKGEPTVPPEGLIAQTVPRRRGASLVDMVAAVTNKHSVAWKGYFEALKTAGYDYQRCITALTRPENRAFFKVEDPRFIIRRSERNAPETVPSITVFLSHVTLIIVPHNLVKQWKNEIAKHTTGLNVLIMCNTEPIPPVNELLQYDILLFSVVRFTRILHEDQYSKDCPLYHIHFKRCIIDEAHKLGNVTRATNSSQLNMLDRLQISARWAVTGTPSRGLFGVEDKDLAKVAASHGTGLMKAHRPKDEKLDLARLGNLIANYLQVRPWAKSPSNPGETSVVGNPTASYQQGRRWAKSLKKQGETPAKWSTYVREYSGSECLRSTLKALLVRHRIGDVNFLLPPVHEEIVVLDGSYQDLLSLNLFSMMIIFNSVQSQRTGVDYFFHRDQRKSLDQLVRNLRQATFFGGVFFSAKEIVKAVDTAQEFLDKGEIPLSDEDKVLLVDAIKFGRVAANNSLKTVSKRFGAIPLYLEHFPGEGGKFWSLDEKQGDGGLICTEAGLVRSLQDLLTPCPESAVSLRRIWDIKNLNHQGQHLRALASASSDDDGRIIIQTSRKYPLEKKPLAGKITLGDDFRGGRKTPKHAGTQPIADVVEPHTGSGVAGSSFEISGPLARTRLISTASAKLSYLIDSITKYQDAEQILIFYENENIAFYLASVLEVLQIQHLIYAKAGLSPERRALYVATFTKSRKFRVMLMDIRQAALGLDLQSASRIYFISPVMNPHVQAQAIGRARRVGQTKPVSVETLVLRHSIEEVIVQKKVRMTLSENMKLKNVLDVGPINEWIRNSKIVPMGHVEEGPGQTKMLSSPPHIFGRGFTRVANPDEDLIADMGPGLNGNSKRPRSPATSEVGDGQSTDAERPPKRRRAGITWAEGV
ncbi:hypothetical protein F5Y17DRAFT_9517 [Xylariaceae sp. FL0594]|nr:hypothetical protein F5Y17DRAFT_9517 [Xylariaceae sp. FL0594]